MRSHLFLYHNYTLQYDFCQLGCANNLGFTYCKNRAQRISFEEKQTTKSGVDNALFIVFYTINDAKKDYTHKPMSI